MRNAIQELVVPALILFLVVLARAQAPDVVNLPNFEEIARDDKIMYFIDVKDAARMGRWITVDVLGAHYQMDPKPATTYALNNIAYIVTTFRIDCQTKTGMRLHDKGVWKGEPIDETFKNPIAEKPTKSRKLYVVIKTVCGGKNPVYKWTGGNGCNLIGGGDAEKECCVDHDKLYRTGGGMRVKWQADSSLFKCVWRHNKLLAPFTFVGANVGGLFAFHWGEKRNLNRSMETTEWKHLLTPQNYELASLVNP